MILAIHHMDGRCIAESWFGEEALIAIPIWTRNVIQREFECSRDDIGMSATEEDVFTVCGHPVVRIVERKMN